MAAPSERIVSLQILRFVAVALVVALHATCWPSQDRAACGVHSIAAVGAAGVDIFFVLSGFVIAITGPLATPRPSGALFFWRRWRRVAPIYYLLSLPFVALAIAAGNLNAPQLIDTFLFWPAAGKGIVYPFLGPGWTLGFEMIFYSTVSLALIGGRVGRNLAILAGLAGVGVVGRLLSDSNALRVVVNPIFLEFGAGMALAWTWPHLRRAPLWVGWVLALAAMATFAGETATGAVGPIAGAEVLAGAAAMRVLAFGVPAAALVAAGAILNRVLAGRLVNVAAGLGDASYSTYLTQGMTVLVVAAAVNAIGAPFAVIVALAFGLSIAVGVFTHAIIERPILRDLKQLSFPWPAGRAAVVAPAQPPAPV